jgi:hypothetical protein
VTTIYRFRYRAEVSAIAPRHGLDPALVEAICLHESYDPSLPAADSRGVAHAFRYEPAYWRRYLHGRPEYDGANPLRVSSSYGLMQIMYPTARAEGYPAGEPPEGLFVPTVNLEYGCRAFARCLRWADGDVPAALAAYNGGRTADNRPSVRPKRNQAYIDALDPWIARVRLGEVIA